MKKIFLFTLFVCCSAVLTIAQSGPVMQFQSDEVNYGEIEQNGEPLRTWTFSNVGDEPLVIKNAKGSCGCTVPSWPKEPIMPGETGKIEVRYDTKRVGAINKTITLTTNEKSGEARKIKVLGKINPVAVEENIPANEGKMF